MHANFLRNIHLPDPSQDSFSLFKSQIYWPQVLGSHHILILTDQRACGNNSVKRRIFKTWTCNLADDKDNEQTSMIQRYMEHRKEKKGKNPTLTYRKKRRVF